MPIWLIGIGLLAAFIIISTLIYKTTVMLYNKKITEIDALKEKCKTETEEKVAAYVAIRQLMYSEMNDVLKRCLDKGYSEEEDRAVFASLYDVFVKLNGNHDSAEKKAIFYSIPYLETIRLTNPEYLYRHMNNNNTWIYDNDIADSKLSNSLSNERKIKMNAGKGIAQPE